jgi:hypothetical protein
MGVYNDWAFSSPDTYGYCPNCPTNGTVAFTVLSDDGNNMYFWDYREAPDYLADSGFTFFYPDLLLAGTFDEATMGAPGMMLQYACVNGAQLGRGLGFFNDPLRYDGPTGTVRAVQAGVFVDGTFPSAVRGLIVGPKLARDPAGYVSATQQGGNNVWTTYVAYNSNSILNGQMCIYDPNDGYTKPPSQQNVYTNVNPPSTFSFSKVTIVETAVRTVSTPPMSITPQSENVQPGVPVTFTAVYSDPGGYQYINFADLLINLDLDGRHACYVTFSPYNANLNLVADDGSNYTTTQPTPPGSINNPLGNLSNSQCTINGAQSSIAENGNTLTLTLSITFSASFVGNVPGNAGNLLIYMADQGSQTVPWTPMGVVKISGPPSYPNATSLSPATSSAQSQQFTASWQDLSLYQNLYSVQVLMNSTLNGAGACYVTYQQGTNMLNLVSDDGGTYTSMPLNGSGSLTNSQCTINGAGSYVTGSGNTFSLTLSVGAAASFQGPRVVWTAAQTNNSNTPNNTGWQPMGLWNVP